MLRLTHTQVAQGAHYIPDIDDGLPRKTAGRGNGAPKRFDRDGNSPGGVDRSVKPGVNFDKQKCYVPRVKAGEVTIAGYIDVAESDAVLLSQARGTINGLRVANHITVTSFLATDLAAPVLTLADKDTPGAGDLRITGTGLTSLAPDITTVILTGTAAITLTQSQITTGGGSISATQINIPAALIPGVALTTTSAQIRADGQLSAVVALT